MDWLTIDRKARLAGCLTAAAALTLGMAVPLFVGPDVLTALLVFAVLTVVPFLAIEGVHTLRRTLGGDRMTGSSLAFSVLFLVGLAGSVAVMGHAATHWRGRGQMALFAGRRIHLAWLYLLVPLALFAGLLAIRPGSAIADLVELYARGIAVDQGRGLGPGLWMVVWLGVVLGPVTAGVVHVTMEYPERTDLYYGTALVYLATLAVLFLWGLSYRTVGVPLAFGDADRALVFRYGAPAVFMLPYGVCAYTVGRALYYRDGRLLTWTLLAWAVVILQALFYMWYALERFLGGGAVGMKEKSPIEDDSVSHDLVETVSTV